MRESLIKRKSFEFAIMIVRFCKGLIAEKEFVLSKQLLRSGTSIGANVREALNSQSKKEFLHKLSISQKECDETLFWLEVLLASDLVSDPQYHELHDEASSLLRIIRSIILTTRKNMKETESSSSPRN
jgi:four helix bundle protein